MAQKAKYGTEGHVQNIISCFISTKLMEPIKRWSLKDMLLLIHGAISVRQILISFVKVEIVVRKFWENLTFIFSLNRSIFCQKN